MLEPEGKNGGTLLHITFKRQTNSSRSYWGTDLLLMRLAELCGKLLWIQRSEWRFGCFVTVLKGTHECSWSEAATNKDVRGWLADTITSINSYSGLCIGSTPSDSIACSKPTRCGYFSLIHVSTKCLLCLPVPWLKQSKVFALRTQIWPAMPFRDCRWFMCGKNIPKARLYLKILRARLTARLIMEDGEERHILWCDCLWKSSARS